jgi:hypothetical protein
LQLLRAEETADLICSVLFSHGLLVMMLPPAYCQ